MEAHMGWIWDGMWLSLQKAKKCDRPFAWFFMVAEPRGCSIVAEILTFCLEKSER